MTFGMVFEITEITGKIGIIRTFFFLRVCVGGRGRVFPHNEMRVCADYKGWVQVMLVTIRMGCFDILRLLSAEKWL